MKTQTMLTLAIEAAIGGGSLSILDRQREIDFWIGDRTVSKSEDVLENLKELLVKNGLNKKEIQTVAVSAQAGSATGSAIGMATAKGLAKSLGCRLEVVSLVPSLYESVRRSGIETAVVIPFGKRNISYQTFLDGSVKTATVTFDLDSFSKHLTENQNNQKLSVLIHPIIYETLDHKQVGIEGSEMVIRMSENLAQIIGTQLARLIMN